VITRLETAESVAIGHPDKLADQISDSILDAYLEYDEDSRVACETALSGNEVWVFGEVDSTLHLNDEDVRQIVSKVLRGAGYTTKESGIDATGFDLRVSLKQQSLDISQAVHRGEVLGAGDQGIIYGFATQESATQIPLPLHVAHRMTRMLQSVRLLGAPLLPDGKSQATFSVNEDGTRSLVALVVSAQHDASLGQREVEDLLMPQITHLLDQENIEHRAARFYVNPSGRFVVGGPTGDAGLTGRKIAVDTYGGLARHGGGAFSGKDATKVDRSAAYAARLAAKTILAAGLATKAEVSLAYAIGKEHPVAIGVDTFGTGVVDDSKIQSCLLNVLSFTPAKIIQRLELKTPRYAPTATFGHFTHDNYTWEKTNAVEVTWLKADALR